MGGLLLILVCQLLGEFISRSMGLPVPGAVVGLILFLVWLVVRRPGDDAPEARAADGLLTSLPIFYVPAGIGIVVHAQALLTNGLPITVGLILSWAVALLVTGATATLILKVLPGRNP